jgi:hypothetical protein
MIFYLWLELRKFIIKKVYFTVWPVAKIWLISSCGWLSVHLLDKFLNKKMAISTSVFFKEFFNVA